MDEIKKDKIYKNYPIKVDKYGCLNIEAYCDKDSEASEIIPLSFEYLSDNTPCQTIIEKPMFFMRDEFYASKCKKNLDGTRTLTLNGSTLQSEIGRRFKDWDVPYLVIFLTKNPDVTKLRLPYNDIDSAGFIGLIDHINENECITELDLRNNEIGEPGIKHLLYGKRISKLQTLILRANKFGIQNSKRVAVYLLKNPFLKYLDVAENDHNEGSLIYFLTVLRWSCKYNNKTLKVLDLSRPITQCIYSLFNHWHIASTVGIMLRDNASLEELHLQKFNFYCHDIEGMLVNAKYNNTLRLIDLRCNNIGDHGAEMISTWLQERAPLRSLLLGHNIISNHGIRALSRGISFSKLLTLDVSHNRFNDESCVELFHAIKKSPLIEHIRINGNDVGCETAIIIKRMLASKVIRQENIDVKPYQVDNILHLAYYQPSEDL